MRVGNDFSGGFPFIAMAVCKLPVRWRLIDGEAIVCEENGLTLASALHCALDLLEFDGRDLRREPIERRKALLANTCNPRRERIDGRTIPEPERMFPGGET
jgi:ATP-dependent DNA ligase